MGPKLLCLRRYVQNMVDIATTIKKIITGNAMVPAKMPKISNIVVTSFLLELVVDYCCIAQVVNRKNAITATQKRTKNPPIQKLSADILFHLLYFEDFRVMFKYMILVA